MTEIEESTDVLTISFQRSLTRRIFHLLAAVPLVVFVVRALISDKNDFPDSQYPALAMPFLVLMGLASVAGALFLISRAFEIIKYHFDKTADEFCISGRKYLFKNWVAEEMTRKIIDITHEVRETDDHTGSEIYLKFSCYGSVTKTLKCGTRNVSEDNNIADIIERFLKRATDSQPKMNKRRSPIESRGILNRRKTENIEMRFKRMNTGKFQNL